MEKVKKVNNIGYQIFRPILKIYSLIFHFPIIINKNKVPKTGGFILAGTHTSKFDPIIVGNITVRSVHFLSKKELMDKKVLGSILRFMGIIRVDRSKKSNPEAKAEAVEALKDGKILCIFPEGTINKSSEPILPFKYGAVSFAYKSGCPIIPFAIVNKPKIFNYKTRLIIGDPIYVLEDNLEKANNEFEQVVIKLLEEGNEKYGKKGK